MLKAMATRSSAKEIERAAAAWLARRDGGLSEQEQAEFSAWLAADARHLGAYARAEAIMAALERAGAGGTGALRSAPVLAGSGDGEPLVTRRQAVLTGSLAAGLAAAGAGVAFLPSLLSREHYATGRGETREVVLSDGSLLTLNTASQVMVRYSERERRIVLTSGEALFDVAKNKARPFIVEARDTQVRAVGTSFTVKTLPSEPVQILVREGVVEVKQPRRPAAAPVKLSANTVAVASSQSPISTEKLTPSQVTRGLAWREGRIAFDNRTLADAAHEFARYSEIRILVAPDVESQTVTGLFVANDPVGFAKAAALSLGLKAQISNRDISISREGEIE